jgi:hypothetical protein
MLWGMHYAYGRVWLSMTRIHKVRATSTSKTKMRCFVHSNKLDMMHKQP